MMNNTGSPRVGMDSPAFRRSPFAIAMLMFSSLPLHALAQDGTAAPAAPAAAATPAVTQLQQVEVRGNRA